MEGTLRTPTAPLVLGLVLVGCVSTDEYESAKRANEHLRQAVADLSDFQTRLEAENSQLRENLIRIGKSAADAEWIRQQKEKLDRLLTQFESGGIQAPAGVTLKATSEGLAFQVQGEVLFQSGSADITTQGKATLASLIPTLQATPSIRVDGHTDTDPITHSRWPSNLDLSAARALSVAHFLTSNGLAEEAVAIAAFGQYRPAEVGSTPEAKSANRRVEILMVDRR